MPDDPKSYPAVGRAMLWVDKPGSAKKIFLALFLACVVLFLLDFTFDAHGHFTMESVPGFFGAFGFVAFAAVIFGAKALRVLIKRSEDIYQDKSIDTEEYPAPGLDKVDHDA